MWCWCTTNIKKDSGLTVTLHDDDVIESSHTAQLPTNVSLSSAATITAILPRLASSSLVSLPQFCDHGCECLLTKDSLHIVKGGNFILDPKQPGTQVLDGTRNKKDRLWDIPIPQITPPFSKTATSQLIHKCNNAFHIDNVTSSTLESTINYYTQQDSPSNLSSSISTNKLSSTSSSIHELNVIIRKRQLKRSSKFLGPVFV